MGAVRGRAGTTAVTSAAPASVLARLRSLVPTLSRGPAAVGRTVLDDPRQAVPMTVQQLAAHAQASEASVIRLAQAAGCSGYREFRTLLAAAAAQEEVNRPSGLPADISAGDDPGVVVAKLAAEERQALADTAASLDVAALEAAADAIVAARRIVIAGIGASGLVAEDLSTKLERIGLTARAVTEGHMAMTLTVLMEPDELLVVISASGETTDIIEPLAAAKEAGVPTVALTVRPRSTLTSADHVLIGVAARESGMRSAAMSSRTGQLFIVDVLFTLVFQRCGARARDAVGTSHRRLAPRRRKAGNPS
ncbi:MAG: MurR/RpiR family transcriptional regulator [Brevibacterium sp.]